MIDHPLLDFPEVPKADRPKTLYIAEQLPEDVFKVVEYRGWKIVDIRLLPSATDSERAAAVRATLEGARVRSLSLTPQQHKQLELEARACGLIGTKEMGSDPSLEATNQRLLKDLLHIANPAPLPANSPIHKLMQVRNQRKENLRGVALKHKLASLVKEGKLDAAKVLEENDGYLPSIKNMV